MSFSRAQQPEWQGLIKLAWAAHCRHEGLAPSPKWERSWYEQELFWATGQTSTSECNAGRDYDRAMAHFEGLAGSGIKWQMKIHTGDANRLRHELAEVTGEHDLDEEYFRGVARQMLRLERLPALSDLTREQLIVILGEVKRFARRRLKREAAAKLELVPAEAEEEESPF